MKENTVITKKRFLEVLLSNFLTRCRNNDDAQEKINNIYEGYKILFSNQLKSSEGNKEKLQEYGEILENVYKMFSDPEFRELISKSGLKRDTIIKMYSGRLLDDNARTYEMTKLYDESLIGYTNTKNGKKRNIIYVESINKGNTDSSEAKEHVFIDSQGRKIGIYPIGELQYVTSLGVRKSISKYKVNRQVDDSKYVSDEFFTNISVLNMGNSEYKDAVLSELLGENNTSLSNTSGYIGTINEADEKLKDREEKFEGLRYFYKINDKYSLEYDAEDATAVMIYQQEVEKQAKKEEIQEER